MTRLQKILIFTILGCCIVFVTTFLKTPSPTDIPYHSSDGAYMLRQYEERMDIAAKPCCWKGFSQESDLKIETKPQDKGVYILAVRPRTTMGLRLLKHRNREWPFGKEVKDGDEFFDYDEIAPLLLNLEPNTMLRLNEDFVAISHKGNIRVYIISRASDATKHLIEKLGVTQPLLDGMNGDLKDR